MNELFRGYLPKILVKLDIFGVLSQSMVLERKVPYVKDEKVEQYL